MNMSQFESSYQAWLEYHLSRRSGERLRRLKEAHGYGERILVENLWWPAIGNLVMSGWIPFHFSHDELHENPRACQQELLQLMGRLFSTADADRSAVSAGERDLLRCMARAGRPVRMAELIADSGKSYYIVRQIVYALLQKKLVHPFSGSQRIRAYALDKEAYRFLF